ncbi:hypothetical protein OSB04_013396 [Centaurea solstitialis]|uniref:F-box domain-containing protein n=1 Tax=Centaurea solstitialis TaxID=347529 RepID=A0AA38WFG5_9ASTR|nr:hypothetical protein OSB04_013396 [Centaurea solstitialis]
MNSVTTPKSKKSIVNSNVKFHLFLLPFICFEIFLNLMTGYHKGMLLTCAEKDRISDLPQHLIGSILERLPIEDAIRTSILSKSWRYRWTTITVLLFDEQFSKKFVENEAFGRNGFIRIVNDVLMLHNGPISKFSLHIPRIDLDSFREVDQTMLLISRKRVQELVLTNSNRCYELPSYVSSCLELRTLELENCIFKPLLKLEVFCNLEHLHLRNIDFGANSCGTLVTLPQLRRLVLVTCKNVYYFNIKASQLQALIVFGCPDAMFLRLLDIPCFRVVCLYFVESFEHFLRVERMKLTWLLSNLPKVEGLFMDGRFTKFLSAVEIPKLLPSAVNSLGYLRLDYFQLSDLHQLHAALSLLRNSPNLKKLWMRLQMEPQVMRYDAGPTSIHLESMDCLDKTLNRLQTVEIISLEGSRPTLLFIKLLLAHSPTLVKLTIEPSGTTDAHQRINIAMDVIRFPRASTKAELIFLNPKP